VRAGHVRTGEGARAGTALSGCIPRAHAAGAAVRGGQRDACEYWQELPPATSPARLNADSRRCMGEAPRGTIRAQRTGLLRSHVSVVRVRTSVAGGGVASGNEGR
jgi:hypothetical protein